MTHIVNTGIAGSLCALALEWIGYVPNAVQTTAVKDALHGLMSLIPAGLYAIGLIIVIFYPLNKARFETLQQELREKRSEEQ